MSSESYIKKIGKIINKIKSLPLRNGKRPTLSSTEMRLLGEIILAKSNGKRIISTQLASALGVTRSAISQMVNKLEKKEIVKRVSDDVDKKIAYIELSDKAEKIYEDEKEKDCLMLKQVVNKMGEEKLKNLLELLEEFADELVQLHECKTEEESEEIHCLN